jgi:hypothetical protein
MCNWVFLRSDCRMDCIYVFIMVCAILPFHSRVLAELLKARVVRSTFTPNRPMLSKVCVCLVRETASIRCITLIGPCTLYIKSRKIELQIGPLVVECRMHSRSLVVG